LINPELVREFVRQREEMVEMELRNKGLFYKGASSLFLIPAISLFSFSSSFDHHTLQSGKMKEKEREMK